MCDILESLIQISHGLSVHFGNNCEIVIHDIKNKTLEHSIVYIENGYITNRSIGDGASAIVAETIKSSPHLLKDKLAYLTKTEDGKILKSSTIYIRDNDGLISYILSINYDISMMCTLKNTLDNFTFCNEYDNKQPSTITHNVNGLLSSLLEESVALIGKPVSLMNREDKIKAIKFLDTAGAFLITKSGDKISSYFGISKFTLYNYLDSSK